MQRVDNAPDNLFVNGNPSTGTKGTTVKAEWLNAVQEELAAVVEAAGITLDPEDNGQVLAALLRMVQPGMMQIWPLETPPGGWLECDGSAVSRTTYSGLFAAIGTAFGTGDGSTTFNLPDLRGEFVRGWDHGRGVDSGRSIASNQDEEINTASLTLKTKALAASGSNQGILSPTYTSTLPLDNVLTSGAGAETRPRNVALMYCIKY